MRVAVILTGRERGFRRIAHLLRRNLLELNNAVVFVACETEDPDGFRSQLDGIEIGGSCLRPSFRDPEFQALITMIWSTGRPGLLPDVFTRSNEPWSIHYVWNSGTLIQYYQVWKAWSQLVAYEKANGIRFDTVVRWRTDAILTEPLDLSKLTTNADEQTCRSMGSDRIRRANEIRTPNLEYEHPYGYPFGEKVVWTLGLEQCWIANRDVFALLGPMVYQYGCWDSGGLYAFNSESFFQQFCIANHIVHWGFIEHNQNIFNEGDVNDPHVFSLLR